MDLKLTENKDEKGLKLAGEKNGLKLVEIKDKMV